MNRPFNVTRESYNLNISNEWLFPSKKYENEEDKKDKYELNFVLDGGNGYNCTCTNDLIRNIYKEDKTDSAANVFWNYKDQIYDYLIYENLDDCYYGDDTKYLLNNFDYFFKEGEDKAIKTFKKNINTKSLPYKFIMDKNTTKNEFKAELTNNLLIIKDEIELIANKVVEDLKKEGDGFNHVDNRKSTLIRKFNKYASQIEGLSDLLYNKITKSPKTN